MPHRRRVGAGARAAAGVLACATPRARAPGYVAVEVAADGHEFTSGGAHFEYQRAHRVRALAPSSGPAEGGALVRVAGHGFARRAAVLGYLACRFNRSSAAAAWRGAAEVRCIAPAHAAGVVGVELTQNAQQHTGDGALFEYARALAHSVRPSAGPPRGGTLVEVRGAGFARARRRRTRAALPVWRGCGGARDSREWCARALRRAARRRGARGGAAARARRRRGVWRRGGVRVPRGGRGAPRAPPRGRTRRRHAPRRLWLGLWRRRRRRWSRPRHDGVGGTVPHRRRAVPARARGGGACSRARRARARARGDVAVEVAADGHEFTSGGAHFEYQRAHRVRALAPSSGPAEGGALVRVAGHGFARRAAVLGYLACRFNRSSAAAAWRGAAEVRCIAPAHAAGVVGVELTQNAQQHTGDGALFEYARALAHSVRPSAGPPRGGTLVEVRGAGFGARGGGARALHCQFGAGAAVRATRASGVLVRCVARRPPPRSAGRYGCACSTATRCVAARRRSCTAWRARCTACTPSRADSAAARSSPSLARALAAAAAAAVEPASARRRRRHGAASATRRCRRARGGGRARVRDAARARAWVRCCRGGGRWARVHVGRCAL